MSESKQESPPQPIELHISDIRTFKQCRRKWYFSSLMPDCLGKEPRVPYAPFFTGRAIHYVLEQMYETNEHPSDIFYGWLEEAIKEMEATAGALWPAEKEKIEEQVHLIVGMLDHYVVWQEHSKSINDDWNLRWLATELTFDVPIGKSFKRINEDTGEIDTFHWIDSYFLGRTPTTLAGRFDGVVERISDGTLWLFETKTTRSVKELVRTLVNDEQAGLYCWAVQEVIGKPIAGVLYNILRKKPPTIPRILKDGTISRAMNIDTTLEVYWQTLKDHYTELMDGMDWSIDELKDDYREVLEHLEQKGNTFFLRYEVRKTQTELRTLVSYLLSTAKEMLGADTVLYPAPGWMNCNFCHFRAPCLLMNAGGDVDFILDQEYKDREPYKTKGEEELDANSTY